MLWEGSCLPRCPSLPVLPLYIFQLQTGGDNGEHKHIYSSESSPDPSSPCCLHFRIVFPPTPPATLGHALDLWSLGVLKEHVWGAELPSAQGVVALLF